MQNNMLLVASDCIGHDEERIKLVIPKLGDYLVWDIAKEILRPGYVERLVTFCKLRKIDNLYTVGLISLFRGSVTQLISLLVQLHKNGTTVHIIDLDGKTPASVVMAIGKWVSETKSLAQKASLARARSEGGRIGRPPKELDIHRLKRLQAEGKSYRDIAEITGLSASTVLRRLEAAKELAP